MLAERAPGARRTRLDPRNRLSRPAHARAADGDFGGASGLRMAREAVLYTTSGDTTSDQLGGEEAPGGLPEQHCEQSLPGRGEQCISKAGGRARSRSRRPAAGGTRPRCRLRHAHSGQVNAQFGQNRSSAASRLARGYMNRDTGSPTGFPCAFSQPQGGVSGPVQGIRPRRVRTAVKPLPRAKARSAYPRRTVPIRRSR